MTQKLVTIFGGSGFIGRYLVRHLAAQGWRIRVAVRDTQAAAFLKPAGNVGQITLVPCTISDPASVAAALKDSDAVVNLVGVMYDRAPRGFDAMHVTGAETVAKAATAAGVERLLHVSAMGADADSPSAYAQSKAAGEETVRAAFPKATIFRPCVVFGTEDGFFNRFGRMAQLLPFIVLFTDTNPHDATASGAKFQPVYVGDVVEAMAQALAGDGHAGKTYELAGPRAYAMREIVALVNRETQRNRLVLGVPYIIAEFAAFFLQLLPTPLLTPDQVKLLKLGNLPSGKKPGLAVFGITPTTVEVVVPTYLKRYRPVQQTKKLRLQAR